MALKFKWYKEQLMTEKDCKHAFALLRLQKPKYFAFDTETTGLNICMDKPFFFQFGWLNTEPNEDNQIYEQHAYSFGVDLEQDPQLSRKVIRSFWNYLLQRTLDGDEIVLVGQNIKYDMHQCANIELLFDERVPITELQFWIRYAHDALQTQEGGPPLGLKDYATKYLDRKAKNQDRLLKQEQSSMAKKMNNDLKNRLAIDRCKVPEHLQHKYKSITLSCVQELFKDPIFEISMLPQDIRASYLAWKRELPGWLQKKVISLVDPESIPYNQLNRTVMTRYALDDIVWTLEAFHQCKAVAERRENTTAIYDIENPSLWPIWRMERTGFKIDVEYLEHSRLRLREHILKRRRELYELTQTEFTVGQHAFIKDLLTNDFNLSITSTSAPELDKIMSQLSRNKDNPRAEKCIKLIQDLRTLEKWYSVYITRFKVDLDYYNIDHIWTQFNSVGAVSGRFTSNMQQMPKAGINIDPDTGDLINPRNNPNAIELFNPRRIVVVPHDKGYAGMAIIDYDGEELRFQAFYTILCGDPDVNLCRAFMPYLCHRQDGTKFDYTKPEHVAQWNTGDWYLDEKPDRLWEPVDLHGAMTINCGWQKSDIDFLTYRNTVGKRLNFAKQYGCGYKRIVEMFPEFTYEKCKQLDEAYYVTFPGVRTYHKYCEHMCETRDYVVNLFGTKYYNISGHKCKNMLVQGSCASFLKIKLKELDDYIKQNKLNTKMLAAIHDEIDFYVWPGEEHHIEEFVKIMTRWDSAYIPLVAEPDYGTSNWAEIGGSCYYDWKEKQNV